MGNTTESGPDESPSPPSEQKLSQPPAGRFIQSWQSSVDVGLANIPLLVCCFITGLLDTVMFQAYGTFVSMQTGNTIFLALGASDQDAKPYAWARSLCSIGFFALGALFFSRFHRTLSPSGPQRGSLAAGFLIQAACVCIAAAMIQGRVVSEVLSDDVSAGWNVLAPIAFLSFQAAGQIVASRVLGVNEVPTVVITSLLCDLMSDPSLVARPFIHGNRKRGNRVAGFILTLVGSIVGGWVLKGTRQVQPTLWLVFGLKLAISLSWTVWKAREVEGEV